MADITQSNDDEESTSEESREKKLLAQAHARFKTETEATNERRRVALEDLKFRAGEQWDQSIRAQRELDRRPCLTINKIPQFVQQITNDQRQNRPSLKVHPVDSAADPETAKVIQGLVRHIEYNSSADAAYDTAFEGAVIGGFGYWRVITEYADPASFDQEIMIKRIPNPFSVRFDPHSVEPDGSDAEWASVEEILSKDEYRAKYPDSEMASADSWDMVGATNPDWIEDGSARVAEYFYKEYVKKQIALLQDGSIVEKSKVPKGTPIVKERMARIPAIKWCKINGCEILEETDWPGMYIPIVPTYGQDLNVDGDRILEGIVRHAKDPARAYNYWNSAQTETIALAPRTPWIVEEGQVEGYEDDWASANTRNHAYLKYKGKSINGQPIGPPQRQAFEPAIQGITQAMMMASDNIKATTGIYDSSLGNRSNEVSGVAIQRRNQQAQTSNFHFVDNLNRSQKHTGRIVVDLIPYVYDTARVIRIIGDEEAQELVSVNQPIIVDGKPIIYKLDTGKYDVTLETGPSFASKRQEAAASMMEISKTNPQMMQIAGDLMVKNMDWPGAEQVAERLKKMLPPQLQEPDKNAPPVPPQVQQKMQQMSKMVEDLTTQLHKVHDERDQKLLELESKERIEFKKLEVQLEIERAKLDAKDSLALLSAEISGIENRLKMLNVGIPMDAEQQQMDQAQAPQGMPPQEMPPQQMPGGPPAGAPMDGPNPSGGGSPGQPMGQPEGSMQ